MKFWIPRVKCFGKDPEPGHLSHRARPFICHLAVQIDRPLPLCERDLAAKDAEIASNKLFSLCQAAAIWNYEGARALLFIAINESDSIWNRLRDHTRNWNLKWKKQQLAFHVCTRVQGVWFLLSRRVSVGCVCI